VLGLPLASRFLSYRRIESRLQTILLRRRFLGIIQRKYA
jgi:hypothetical protein